MEDNVIDIKGEEVQEDKQLTEAKEQFKQVIDEADGVILLAFKNEKNEQGQLIPKSLYKAPYGFAAFGNPNFYYAEAKMSEMVDNLNKAEAAQKAKISE